MAEERTPPELRPDSLYQRAISRRSVLAGAAVFGAVLAVPALACGGKSDKAVFSSTTQVPGTTVPSGGSSTSATGISIPASGQVAIDFTYAATGGGNAENPYIAVWVETATGTFVDTISLWYSSGENERYLSDMRSWMSSSGGTDRSMSGATRTAGSYSVVWDGKDASGQKMPQGEYLFFIECAREKGPYEVISQPLTIAAVPASASPSGKGEISKVSMTYTP
ncbi:MAG: hypothetical protein RL486_1333 [Actinomycetota bacterium]|jgi:hypothetical protein